MVLLLYTMTFQPLKVHAGTEVQRLVLILPPFNQTRRGSPESAAREPGVDFARSNWDFLLQLKWIPYEDQQAVLHQHGRCQISLPGQLSGFMSTLCVN